MGQHNCELDAEEVNLKAGKLIDLELENVDVPSISIQLTGKLIDLELENAKEK